MSQQRQGAERSRRFVDLLSRRRPVSEGGARRGALTVTRLEHGGVIGEDSHPEGEAQAISEALEFSAGGENRLLVLGIDLPTPEQIAQLATDWDLHPLLVEDLMKAGQRPKLERYGDVLFVVTRAATYVDAAEEVDISEFHLLSRNNVVVVLCQDRAPETSRSVQRIPRNAELLSLGAEAVVYSLLDAVVDGYFPVVNGLTVDREQIERQVFEGDPKVTERIYRLSREVIDLQHAAGPLGDVLDALRAGFGKYGIDEGLRAYLQDVTDHLSRLNTGILELRDALTQILEVNSTLVSQRQNEDMKKISGWAAILFAPTLIGAIYGMNFDDMPELHWAFGYPMAVGAMVALGAVLWAVFKWRKWM